MTGTPPLHPGLSGLLVLSPWVVRRGQYHGHPCGTRVMGPVALLPSPTAPGLPEVVISTTMAGGPEIVGTASVPIVLPL